MGTRRKKLDIESIKQAYLSGETLQTIADTHGVSRHTVKKRLLRSGISIHQNAGSKANIVDVNLDQLAEDYKSGMPAPDLISKYCIGIDAIHMRLDMIGVPRNIPSAHVVNEHFFDDLSLEAPAYWLGVLMADGYMYPDRPRVELSLSEKDKGHLERFKRDIGSSAPIAYRASRVVNGYVCKPIYRFQIQHPYLYSTLVGLGCTPRKSHSLIFPNYLSSASARHFMRGFLDGDGAIYYREPWWVSIIITSCSKEFLFGYERSMHRLISTSSRKIEAKKDGVFRIRWSSKSECIRILEFLYSDCAVALPRKLSRAMYVIKELSK